MMRAAYALAWALATPLILLRLAWRSRRLRGYLERLGERFGRYEPAAAGPRIWVHAVSVGETRAAAPLVDALAARYPGHRILLTHMTPTGRATGVEILGERVERAWLPYDYGFAVRRFLSHFRPAFGIVMETEIWPRLLEECARSGVTVLLANARLSEKSAHRYARFPRLTRWALANLAGIAAQTEADAERFAALGAARPAVTGNIKFDLEVPEASLALGGVLRRRFGERRRVIVAGSTRDGEEALLLEAFARAAPPEALLVLVPRHPQRFDAVEASVRALGLGVARRSADVPVEAAVRVVVGDSMGEMLAYYACADVVIVGGSLLDFGAQNLIEPCALGKPVVVGPSTYNFEEAARGAVAAGAAVQVAGAVAAVKEALAIAADAERALRMGRRAREFAEANRGALARLLAWIGENTARAA
jgi:3-deoxy-D-manno-octulosonic-acid transferase